MVDGLPHAASLDHYFPEISRWPFFEITWLKWLVETRYFSLGEQYYSTAGANWTRMAKQLFVRSCYRNRQCSRSVHGFRWDFVKLKLWYVSFDPESIKSVKILWPENEVTSGSRKSWYFLNMLKIRWFLSKSCIVEAVSHAVCCVTSSCSIAAEANQLS